MKGGRRYLVAEWTPEDISSSKWFESYQAKEASNTFEGYVLLNKNLGRRNALTDEIEEERRKSTKNMG